MTAGSTAVTPYLRIAEGNESPADHAAGHEPIPRRGFFASPEIRTVKCNSPVFAKDIITEYRYTIYLLSIYMDSLQYSSIYPENHFHF